MAKHSKQASYWTRAWAWCEDLWCRYDYSVMFALLAVCAVLSWVTAYSVYARDTSFGQVYCEPAVHLIGVGDSAVCDNGKVLVDVGTIEGNEIGAVVICACGE